MRMILGEDGKFFEKNIDTMEDNGTFVEQVAAKVVEELGTFTMEKVGDLLLYVGGYLPEIMAYGTVLAGSVIMLSGRVGKPIVWWSIAMGVAVLWRLGV